MVYCERVTVKMMFIVYHKKCSFFVVGGFFFLLDTLGSSSEDGVAVGAFMSLFSHTMTLLLIVLSRVLGCVSFAESRITF